MKKNVVVVGGGTAGWLSALFLKKILPEECNITVIASEEIGILGAGEGSVPALVGFLSNLDINANELVLHCGGTIKGGIKFANWLNDETAFNHTFRYIHSQDHFRELSFDEVSIISNKLNLIDFKYSSYDISDLLIDTNKISLSDKFRSSEGKYNLFNFSFHFDANRLAEFLKSIALERGIVYHDDFVENVQLNENGFITNIVCKKATYNCDLVIDCTGFKRLIVGKLYNADWVDVSKRLPVNKAIPFFLPPDKQLESCTTATAMNFGWSWKIPLQHRSGCGYVYSSNFCDQSTATDELIKRFGNVDIPRSFSFDSGYFKNPWIKNCIALGLSGGFLEPLEATSIWTTIHTLTYIREEIDFIFENNQSSIDNVNRKTANMYESNIDFIQFHYFSKRNDTEFWRYMNNDSPQSERLKYFIEILKHRPLNSEELNGTYYHPDSWLKFAIQLNFVEKNSYDRRIERIIKRYPTFLQDRKKYINLLKYELAHCPTQNEFVKKIYDRAAAQNVL